MLSPESRRNNKLLQLPTLMFCSLRNNEKNAFYSNKVVFICWVDYALEGSTFTLSKCDFSRMFHTERSWQTYRFTIVIVSGRQDLQAHFLWPVLKRKAFLLRLNTGSSFLQSAFWIWIAKRVSLVHECSVFLQCCITLGPARQFSFTDSDLQIQNYKNEVQLKLKLHKLTMENWIVTQ